MSTGMPPAEALGNGDSESHAMTTLEIATVTSTVVVFVFIVFTIFACRYLSNKRRAVADAGPSMTVSHQHPPTGNGDNLYKLDELGETPQHPPLAIQDLVEEPAAVRKVPMWRTLMRSKAQGGEGGS